MRANARAGTILFMLAAAAFVSAPLVVGVGYATETTCRGQCYFGLIAVIVAEWLVAAAGLLAAVALVVGLGSRVRRLAAVTIALLGGAVAAWRISQLLATELLGMGRLVLAVYALGLAALCLALVASAARAVASRR